MEKGAGLSLFQFEDLEEEFHADHGRIGIDAILAAAAHIVFDELNLAAQIAGAEDRVLSDVGEYVKNPQEFINRFNLISKASNEEELFSPH